MKNVYSSIWASVVGIILEIISIQESLKGNSTLFWSFFSIIGGVALLFYIFFLFKPLWKYDETSLANWTFIDGWRKYKWDQVEALTSTNLASGTIISLDDKRKIVIAKGLTRNFLKTLSDVVSNVQRNEKTYISPIVLKRVKK